MGCMDKKKVTELDEFIRNYKSLPIKERSRLIVKLRELLERQQNGETVESVSSKKMDWGK